MEAKEYWNKRVEQINDLRKLLDDKPDEYKLGYSVTYGGILNAYREGDLSFEEAKLKLAEIKASQLEPPVILEKGDFSELKNFMANSTARISDRSKWIVFDDNLWFVYEQEYGKRVKKILETENFLEALALLSK